MKKNFLALGKCFVYILWMAFVYWVYLKLFHQTFDGAQWSTIIGFGAIWLYFRNPSSDRTDEKE